MPFKSIDTIVDENKPLNFPADSLNSLDISGTPPHNLPLKEVLQYKKHGNFLVKSLDYIVNASKLPNQDSGVSDESLRTHVAWRCPDGIQHLSCCLMLVISGQTLVSTDPIVDSRVPNFVLGHMEATFNKWFLSSLLKCTVEPS
ncbi:hypothetical protein TNCV_3085241 [Trichonephila clavipes]|nr:hypothetical protein TNCV_3085241 [Trichonephila clavipes]